MKRVSLSDHHDQPVKRPFFYAQSREGVNASSVETPSLQHVALRMWLRWGLKKCAFHQSLPFAFSPQFCTTQILPSYKIQELWDDPVCGYEARIGSDWIPMLSRWSCWENYFLFSRLKKRGEKALLSEMNLGKSSSDLNFFKKHGITAPRSRGLLF